MDLSLDHIEAKDALPGVLGVRRKVSHEAQMIASVDDVMDYIRKKIENASAVRVLYTVNGPNICLFTPEETGDAFKGRF